MALLSILGVILFDVILSLIEIPKMLGKKLYKELAVYSVLLAFSTVLVVIKSLNMDIPRMDDIFTWIYSPVTDLIKPLFH